MKYLLILLLLCPVFGFTQDTLFNKTMSEVTLRSSGKKTTEIAIVNAIRNNLAVSDGVSIDFIKKTPDRTVGDALCSGDDADKPVGVQHPCSKHGEHQYIFAYKLYTQFS